MNTIELSKLQWGSFLDQLSRSNDGRIVYVHLLDSDLGAQPEVSSRPLRGLSYERRGDSLLLTTGDLKGNHLAHVIADPERIFVEQTEAGNAVAVEVVAADGTRTIISFEPEVRSAMKALEPGRDH